MVGSRVAGIHQGHDIDHRLVWTDFEKIRSHLPKAYAKARKRSKKKRQTSKEIFAFAFTFSWCEWTLIWELYEEGLSTKTKVLCKTNHYSFVRVPVTITLGPAITSNLIHKDLLVTSGARCNRAFDDIDVNCMCSFLSEKICSF